MFYLERKPGPKLRPFVKMLWYCRSNQTATHRERILPNGCIQLIINLACDELTDCGSDGTASLPTPPSLIVGASGRCEIVDTSDMAELAGVVFRPGGFPALFGFPADEIFERSISLEDCWKRSSLRNRLMNQRMAENCATEKGEANNQMLLLEDLLGEGLADTAVRNSMVDEALWRFRSCGIGVAEAAKQSGFSQRRFSTVFREQVGLSPKLWCRIQRFQTAVAALHAGREVAWAELALACGYYDQPHFANDFRAFSGIDPTTYVARRGIWRNHVAID